MGQPPESVSDDAIRAATAEAEANASQIEQAREEGEDPKHKGDKRAESAAGQVEFQTEG